MSQNANRGVSASQQFLRNNADKTIRIWVIIAMRNQGHDDRRKAGYEAKTKEREIGKFKNSRFVPVRFEGLMALACTLVLVACNMPRASAIAF
jgi:hypothetical protein